MKAIISYIEKVLKDAFKSVYDLENFIPPYCLCSLGGQLFLLSGADTHVQRRVEYRLLNNFERNFGRKIIVAGSFCANPMNGFTVIEYPEDYVHYGFDSLILPIQHIDGGVNRIYTIVTYIEPKLEEDWKSHQKLPAAKYLTPHFFDRIPESDQSAFPGRTFGKVDSDLWYDTHTQLMNEYRERTNASNAFGYLYEQINYNDFCYAYKLAFGFYPKALNDIRFISMCGDWKVPPVDRNFVPEWKQ